MIKEKVKEEMDRQGYTQIKMVRAVSNLNKQKTLSQPQLSNYLSDKGALPIHHIESIFEVLGISLIRIL